MGSTLLSAQSSLSTCCFEVRLASILPSCPTMVRNTPVESWGSEFTPKLPLCSGYQILCSKLLFQVPHVLCCSPSPTIINLITCWSEVRCWKGENLATLDETEAEILNEDWLLREILRIVLLSRSFLRPDFPPPPRTLYFLRAVWLGLVVKWLQNLSQR